MSASPFSLDPAARQLDVLLAAALGRGWDQPQPQRAAQLLAAMRAQRAELPTAAALLAGDLPTVQRRLAGTDLDAPLAPWGAPPLAYAAFSSLARLPGHEAGLVTTLDWLLDQGASPQAVLVDPETPGDPLPVLYGAVARAGSLAMVQGLLRAGAEPNDGESLYHATEGRDRARSAAMVAALVAAGARFDGTLALHRLLDVEDPPGLAQALQLGASAHDTGPGGLGPLHHAVRRGRSVQVLQLLLDHGADPRAADAAGHTPAWHAARLGESALLALLRARGAGPDEAPHEDDDFLAACGAADGETARALLAERPGLVQRLGDEALRLLPDQAQRGRIGSVALMLTLGWPVATPGDWGGGALNQAAFRGDAAMVQLLLAYGAQWDEPNAFGGTALGACLHAACNTEPEPGADHAAVLALLLAAGAPLPDAELLEELPPALQQAVREAGGAAAAGTA